MMSQELDVKRLFNVSIQELAWLKRQITASWVWLMFISLGLGMAVGYWAWRQKPQYQPSVRALLNLDQGGTSSLGLSSISSMLTGTNNAFVMNLERNKEYILSDANVHQVLLKPVRLGQRTDLLIHFFLDLGDWRKKWSENSKPKIRALAKVKFNPYQSVDSLSPYQVFVLKSVASTILLNKQLLTDFDKKSGVFIIQFKHHHQGFAIKFLETVYSSLLEFQTSQHAGAVNRNLQYAERKLDSAKRVLNQIEQQLASSKDQTMGLVRQQDRLGQKELEFKEQMLLSGLLEAQRNVETIRFMNQSTKPPFTILSWPRAPMVPKYYRLRLIVPLASMAGLILSLVFLRLRKAWNSWYSGLRNDLVRVAE